MSYNIKNPKNVIRLVESLRRLEWDIQNIKCSSSCPHVTHNANLAEGHASDVHECINQMAIDLGLEESIITDNVTTQAWPSGK